MRKQEGLTLLELLTVIVIIGVLAAVTLPNFSSWNCQRRMANEFRQVVALFQAAQLQALSSGQTIKIVIDHEAGTLTAFKPLNRSQRNVGCDLADNQWEIVAAPETLKSIPLERLSVASAVSPFCFYPVDYPQDDRDPGFAHAPDNLTLNQNACGGQDVMYRLSVLTATGLIEKEKYLPVTATWSDF